MDHFSTHEPLELGNVLPLLVYRIAYLTVSHLAISQTFFGLPFVRISMRPYVRCSATNFGNWILNRGGALEYHPTPEEIAAKCEPLRTIENWRPAHKRAPRGGKYAVPETAGL